MRIQFVAVGLDILRNAQASSSVRLCDSMVTPDKRTPRECEDCYCCGGTGIGLQCVTKICSMQLI